MRRMISTASVSGTTWGSPTAPSWDTSGMNLGTISGTVFYQRVLLTTSQSVPIPFTPLLPEQVVADTPHADVSFLSTLNDWAKLSPALNEMAASLGHATMYPFIQGLPPASTMNTRMKGAAAA